MDRLRLLVIAAVSGQNESFSYQHGWPRALATDPRVSCTFVNLLEEKSSQKLSQFLRLASSGYDATILLHSVFSNQCYLGGKRLWALQQNRTPKVYFIGNEYKLMPEKMQFVEQTGVGLLVSQSSSELVHRAYRERLGIPVAYIPNTGFDPSALPPLKRPEERPVDLGYRSVEAPPYLGHDERSRIAETFADRAPAHGLEVDISLRTEDRFDSEGWYAFLNRCRAQLGTEAGCDYFELDDRTRNRINAYLQKHPAADIAEIRRLFFDGSRRDIPMRILSGRNVEAAALRSIQILMEGRYDGHLLPDIHYIPVRRDLADVDDALNKLQDAGHVRKILDAAESLVHDRFTWPALVGRLLNLLRPLVEKKAPEDLATIRPDEGVLRHHSADPDTISKPS